MSGVSRDEIRHLAALAQLSVEESALAGLTEEIGRILEYVARLEAVEGGEAGDVGEGVGPGRALRQDEVRPAVLPLDPMQFAPAFEDGLFLGPRASRVDE